MRSSSRRGPHRGLPTSRSPPLPRGAIRRRHGDPGPDGRRRLAGLQRHRRSIRPRPGRPLPVPAVHPADPARGACRRPIRPASDPARHLRAAGRLRARAPRPDAGRRDRPRADLRGDGRLRHRARLQPAHRPGAAAQPGADRALPAGGGGELVALADRDDRGSRRRRRARPLRRRGRVCRCARSARPRGRSRRRPARRGAVGAFRRAGVMEHAAVRRHVRPIAPDRARLDLARPVRRPLRRRDGTAPALCRRDPRRWARGSWRHAGGAGGRSRAGRRGRRCLADPPSRRQLDVRRRRRVRCRDDRLRALEEPAR